MHFISNPHVRSRGTRVLLCLGLVGLCPGCAHVYTVKVDALRSPDPAPRRTYRIESLIPERPTTDPHYAEVTALIESALGARGLFPASCAEWADMVVEIDYGVGPRRLKAVHDGYSEYGDAVGVFFPNRGGDKIGEANGIYIPTAAMKRVVAVWEKKLSLAARENTMGGNTNSNSGAELWRVEVVVEDASTSLEESLPVLASAVIEHIDSNSQPACVERISATQSRPLLLSQNH